MDAKSEANKTDDSTNEDVSKEAYLTTIKEYWKSGKFCDVTIVQEGRKIQAHKMVLSIASGYFRAMFSIDMKEANMDEIAIPEISYDNMEQIIEYIYTGEIVITTDNAQSLIMAADYLQMKEFVNLCGRYFIKQINRDNGLSIRKFMLSTGCDKYINDMATIYVTTYFIPISKSDEFLELNIDDVVDLLSFNQLYIDNEQDVYDSGMRWLNAKSDRFVYADRILKCIRLHLLKPSFLTSVVSRDVLFRPASCQELISPVLQYQSNSLGSSTKLMSSPLSHRSCTTMPGKIGILQRGANNLMESAIYDLSTRTWSEYHSSRLRYPTSLVCKISNNGQMYITHGRPLYSQIVKLDPTTKELIRVAAIPRDQTRMDCAAAVLYNKLYLIGGFYHSRDWTRANPAKIPTSDVACFDMATNSWSVSNNMIHKRVMSAAVGVGGYLYVCGGYCEDSDTPSSSVERMNITTGEWECVVPMNEERASCGICVYNGKMYVAGGNGRMKKQTNTFEVYDPDTNMWTMLPSMKIGISDFSLVATVGGIYAVSGRASTAECYSLVDKKWVNAFVDVAAFDCITENAISCLLPTHPYEL